MTPTIISKELLLLNNKMRKPFLEKMRKDCINSSIKQAGESRLLKHFQKLQTSCEQNRRESVVPDQKTFTEKKNANKSSIWRPW